MKVVTSITINYDIMIKVKNKLKPREFSPLIEFLLTKWAENNVYDEKLEKTKDQLKQEEAALLVSLQKIKDKKRSIEEKEKEIQTKLEEENKKERVIFSSENEGVKNKF